jgi:hypothetical protein
LQKATIFKQAGQSNKDHDLFTRANINSLIKTVLTAARTFITATHFSRKRAVTVSSDKIDFRKIIPFTTQ